MTIYNVIYLAVGVACVGGMVVGTARVSRSLAANSFATLLLVFVAALGNISQSSVVIVVAQLVLSLGAIGIIAASVRKQRTASPLDGRV